MNDDIPCSSDPTAGCDDSEVIVKLTEFKTEIMNELNTQETLINNVNTALTECCTTLTSKLNTIINLVTIINNKL